MVYAMTIFCGRCLTQIIVGAIKICNMFGGHDWLKYLIESIEPSNRIFKVVRKDYVSRKIFHLLLFCIAV